MEYPAILVGHPEAVELYLADTNSGEAVDFKLLTHANVEPIRIPWMRGGRAWVTWTPIAEEGAGTQSPLVLVSYGEGEIEEIGRVYLPRPVRRVIDTGDVAVVTTDTGIFVVAPGCP